MFLLTKILRSAHHYLTVCLVIIAFNKIFAFSFEYPPIPNAGQLGVNSYTCSFRVPNPSTSASVTWGGIPYGYAIPNTQFQCTGSYSMFYESGPNSGATCLGLFSDLGTGTSIMSSDGIGLINSDSLSYNFMSSNVQNNCTGTAFDDLTDIPLINVFMACGTAGGGNIYVPNLPYASTCTPAGGNFIYVSEGITGLLACQILSNGTLTNCALTGISAPAYFATTVTPDNAHVLAVPYSGGTQPYICALTTSGSQTGALTNCAVAGGGFFNSGTLYTVTASPLSTYAYVGDYSNNIVYVCTITGGVLSACGNASTAFTITNPRAMVINNTNTFMYIATQFNIILCSIMSNGTLSGCSNQETVSGGSNGIILNSTSQYLYYTAITGNTVTQCTVSNINGTLSGCATTGSGVAFNQPWGMTIDASGLYAFIINGGTDELVQCQVSPVNGNLSNCANILSLAGTPRGLASIAF